MTSNSVGIKFTNLDRLKLMLPYLQVDKGSIESLSANDCVLVEQPYVKQTVFTVIDPSRAMIKLNFNHDTLDDSGGINTNQEGHEEFYWSSLLHFPDFIEKISRVFKSNIVSCYLTSNKNGFALKNLSSTNSSSLLSLKSYPGSHSDFLTLPAATLKLIRINALEMLSNLKIVNQFSEASREKRGNSVTSSKHLLFNINYHSNELHILAPSKSQLSCVTSKASIICDNFAKEFHDNYSSFCIEARFIKQLVYISNGAYVDLYVSEESNNNWITFKSDIGEITLIRCKVPSAYRDYSLLFTEEDNIKINNSVLDYKVLYNRAFNTEDILNAALLLQPSKLELFINRLVFLENDDEVSVLPSNDISAKDVVSFKYILSKDNNLIPFLILGNLLIHSLKTILLVSRHYRQERSRVLLTVKELITPKGSTLNLFMKCIITDNNNGEAVIRLDNTFDMWLSIDKVSQNIDLLNIDD